MFYDFADKLPVLDYTFDLLRDRLLGIIVVLRCPREIHVDTSAFAREDLRLQRLPAQVYRS